MGEPQWPLDLALDVHAEQLALFGGADGLRDMGLLESALARPRNKYAYGVDDLAELAALALDWPATMPLSMETSASLSPRSSSFSD